MTEHSAAGDGRTEVVQARSAPAGPGRPASPPRKRPGVMPTILLGLAGFGVIFEFLAFQLSNGNDPALGAGALAASDGAKVTRVERPVVNRRIIKTKVVHDPTPAATGSDGAVPVSSGSTSGVSATTASVPAPAAATAPAPAPAPAPVTSSS